MIKYLCLFLLIIPVCAKAAMPAPPAQFIMDALETPDGDMWIATEGDGVFRLSHGRATWEAMHCKQGFPPTMNTYALAQDSKGRIWAGTDNQGIAIWDGVKWQSLSRREGMPGERVYSVAAHGNSVAISTNGGILIFRDSEQATWRLLTVADGLPNHSGAYLSYKPDGALGGAFLCGGVGIMGRNGTMVATQAPWSFHGADTPFPLDNEGEGIPGNEGNAFLATGDKNAETLLYACTNGLAYKKGRQKWHYLRGKDCRAKARGLLHPPSEDVPEGVLSEDYVTALFADGDTLWIGFRKCGVQTLSLKTMRPTHSPEVAAYNNTAEPEALWIRKFIKRADGSLYAATYGGGLRLVAHLAPEPRNTAPGSSSAPIPTIPKAGDKELTRMAALLTPRKPSSTPPFFFWYEDWLTRGNWCHRYGTSIAVLCAAASPRNVRLTFSNAEGINIKGGIGPHHNSDYLRLWIDSYDNPENLNVLWNPDAGIRTEAEWDDHGEDYDTAFQGPDIKVKLHFPEGTYLLSTYFFNPNGHTKNNRYRDFLLEFQKDGSPHPPARTRVSDFAGCGCWKNFIVSNQGDYTLTIHRQGSLNTILNGVFVSRLHSSPSQDALPDNLALPRLPQQLRDCTVGMLPRRHLEIWRHFIYPEKLQYPELSRPFALAAFRALPDDVPSSLRSFWAFRLQLWTQDSENKFDTSARKAWEHVQSIHTYARSAEWRPHSPGVVPFSVEELETMDEVEIDWRQYTEQKIHSATPSLQELKRMLQNKRTEDIQTTDN